MFPEKQANGLRYLRWGGDGEAVQPEKGYGVGNCLTAKRAADRVSEPQASTVRPAWLDRPEQAHWRLPSPPVGCTLCWAAVC